MSLPKAKARPPGKKEIKNKVDLATSVVESTKNVYDFGYKVWRQNFAYTVTVSEKDPLYFEIFDWLTSVDSKDKHRNITVSSRRGNRDSGVEPDSSESRRERTIPPLQIRYDEGTSKKIKIGPHPVKVAVLVPEVKGANAAQIMEHAYSKIEFLVNSYEAQQAVVALLTEINAKKRTDRKAVLRMIGNWNNWVSRSDIPPRTMESVSLPEEQKTRVLKDLETFLESEDKYNRLAIPWHRGYMFHGPPGTGKTSLVKALANHFNLDLWYISIADLKAEASLISLLAEVGPRSLLLLEDIDTMRITHDRDETQQGTISMGSLLNTLDGVATPHGLITVMTTNRFEILDPALTRAGRMDLIEHLDYPTVNTLIGMYRHFFDRPTKWIIPGRSSVLDKPLVGISTSQIAEIMKRHMDDPIGASKAILPIILEHLK